MNRRIEKRQCPLHAEGCSHRHGHSHVLANVRPYDYWVRETERENRKHRQGYDTPKAAAQAG